MSRAFPFSSAFVFAAAIVIFKKRQFKKRERNAYILRRLPQLAKRLLFV